MTVALVTGASSGIGAAVVRAMAAQGWQVHAVARRADRLATLAAETGCTAHAVDLCDTDAVAALALDIPADVLVNNAGLGAGITGLLSASAEDIARTVDTNVTALLNAVRLFAPGMVARRSGHIVNIGSVAGLYPTVSAVYGGTKGAVRLISQNLRIELKGTGVRVTEINPGRVRTEFYDAAIPDPALRDAVKETGIEELTSEDIADGVMFALTRPTRVNIQTLELQPTEQVFGGVGFAPVDRS